MKKTLSNLLLFFCLIAPLDNIAQIAIVKGTISDSKGDVIIGASIFLKGTSNGTISDLQGNFSLKINDLKKDVLTVSYIGYKTETVQILGKTNLNISLQESAINLDEVVAIGYGSSKKSHLTGSVGKLTGENILDVPTSDITTAIQGRISGVSINNTTSEVGVTPQIRIRGIGSISADATPLIVVDGFPVDGGLETLNPNDVVSIEVLKDASSAAIYGSRAANGVILVTTKSGDVEKPTYSIKVYGGYKSALKLHEMMNYSEFVDNVCTPLWNANNTAATSRYSYLAAAWLEKQLGETDWQKLGLQNANTLNGQFSVSGGKDATKYFVSVGYIKDDGLVAQNFSDKFSGRIKLDTKLSNKINFGVNINATLGSSSRPRNNYIDFARFPTWIPVRHNEFTSTLTGAKNGAYAQPRDFNISSAIYPIGLVQDENENWIAGIDENGNQTKVGANPYNSQNNNPISILDGYYQEAKSYQGLGSAYLNWNLLKGLTLKTSNGFNLRYQTNLRYIYANASKDGESNSSTQSGVLTSNWLSENTLNYKTSLNEHDIDFLAGFTAEQTIINTMLLYGLGFPSDYIYTSNAATSFGLLDSNGNMATGSRRDSKSMVSLLGRVNYSYANKYLASIAFRTDGCSLFGEKKRWASFPSVSLGWRITEEAFIKNIKWISNMKLRGGYGITGNNKIPYNANTNLYSGSNYSLGTGTGSITTGLANNSNVYGNESLTWEQTEEWNLGLDFGIVKNRISLSTDVYYSKTHALLFKRPLQSYTGFTQSWANIGRVMNKGVEITLETNNIATKRIKWNTNLNFSITKNMLLELGGEKQIITTGYSGERYINRVGNPVIQFYGYKTKGVIKAVQDETTGNYQTPNGTAYWSNVYTQPGYLDIEDQDANGIIDERDLTVIGDPYSDFTYGITNTFKIMGIDASFLIQGVQGGQLINAEMTYNDMYRRNKRYHPELSWMSNTAQGDGIHPNVLSGIAGANWIYTDYVVQDASYACLRNVTIGYALNKKTTKKLGVSKFRIYATANNLLYWMDNGYLGINPEYRNTNSPYDSPLVAGYQRGSFPVVSTYTFGFDINL